MEDHKGMLGGVDGVVAHEGKSLISVVAHEAKI